MRNRPRKFFTSFIRDCQNLLKLEFPSARRKKTAPLPRFLSVILMPMDENQVLESVPVAGVGENDVLDLGGAGGLAGQSAGTLPLSGSRPSE